MTKVKLLTFAFLSLFVMGNVNAQNQKNAELVVKVSSQCSMCKTTIEKALAFEKGVIRSNLDLESNTVTVVYRTGKTSPEKIRKAISEAGYDADDVASNQKAYQNLPDCCKKPADRKSDHSGHTH